MIQTAGHHYATRHGHGHGLLSGFTSNENILLKHHIPLCMRFYYETKLLYIETGASKVELGATLLQTRSSTSCPRDEAPNNSILRPIAFLSKSLCSME